MSVREPVRVLVAALVALAGCTSATGTTNTNTLTAAQAQWIATFLGGASANGVNAATGSAGLASAPQPVAVNVGVDYTLNCTTSGYIHVLGNVSGSIDDQTGTGVLSLGVTESLVACRSTTQSGGWLELDGDPDLSLAGTLSFVNGSLGTQQSMSLGGAFDWLFDTGQTGSCQINLSILLPSAVGGGSVSGTVCGIQVSANL